MSRNSPTSKQLLSILSDFDEFVEWSKKKKFGVTAADDDLLLRLGEAGEFNSKRLFEDSQTYDNFRYPDYSYLLESTARLMAEDCVEEFLRLPIRIRPSILQIVMTRGSGSLKGYLETLKLAGYPKPNIMSGGETLKSLMLSTQGLAGRQLFLIMTNLTLS